MTEISKIGVVVAGSLGEGVKVRLNGTTSVEDIKVGSNVVIQGQENRTSYTNNNFWIYAFL